MLRVGLSGGIGSGKSTVARRLADLGAVIIDSDLIAREVLAPSTPGLARVTYRFGAEVIDADGALDRAALGQVIFGQESARRDLEAITHPLIATRTAQLFAEAGSRDIVVHDVPLLVEKGMGPDYHLVVIVHTDEAQRLQRLVDDRGMSHDDATARIRSQADDVARRAAADVWLDNAGTATNLRRRVDDLWEQRLKPFEDHVYTRTPSRRPETLSIRDPDPTWPAQAQRLIDRLHAVMGEVALDVEHIGSTAVAGMPAKDVIDLQVVMSDLTDLDGAAGLPRSEALAEAGFPCAGGEWWDRSHSDGFTATWPKRLLLSTDPQRISHVHVRSVRSPARRLAVLFRDWLTADVAAHAEYAALKARLAQQGLSTTAYAQAKEPWFASAFPRAEEWASCTYWTGP